MTDQQTHRLLECFVAGTPARPAAEAAGVNRNTARLYYHRLRETIAQQLDSLDRALLGLGSARPSAGGADAGPTPADSAALPPRQPGSVRVVALAGLIEREGRIHVVQIDDAPVFDPLSAPPIGSTFDAIVCRDDTVSTAVPNEIRQGRLRVVMRDTDEPSRRRVIREFWHQSARLLRRFNGVPRQHLFLYLKECEWRFNDGTAEVRMDTLREWFMRWDRRSGGDRVGGERPQADDQRRPPPEGVESTWGGPALTHEASPAVAGPDTIGEGCRVVRPGSGGPRGPGRRPGRG